MRDGSFSMNALLCCTLMALLTCALGWPADPQPMIKFTRDEAALALSKQIMPASPATLKGSKLPPNYLTGFLSLGTGTELVQAQDQLLKAWNSSAGISQLIADGATQAPVKLPDRFKSGPLNKLLADLVLLYYATCQGVEGARRTYFRQVEFAQRANVTKHGIYGLTNNPFGGAQFVAPRPDKKQPPPFFNDWYGETDPTAGNGVTAYFGSYFDMSQGPLILSFPKITDYFVVTFYNAYGDVFHALGTRVGTNTAKRVLVVQDGAAATSAESQFAKEDIIRVRGVDFQVLGRILGNQRVSECKVEAAIPGKIATVPYWWGVDSAVYYLYNAVDPLYYWKIAALVLARNPRPGLTAEQTSLLQQLHFTSNGLDTSKLSEDQKLALIAAIPIAAQGLAQSFYVIGPKEHGYWYTTCWNSIPGAYIQLNAAFLKGFWLANLIENAAYILQFVDSEARPLNGRYTYTMTFKAAPPTLGAFWSVQTMRLDQFAMADTADFLNTGAVDYVGYVYGAAFSNTPKATSNKGQTLLAAADGSFSLTLSAKPRPSSFKGNYVQVVADVPFYMVLRVYNPSEEVIKDKYAPPPVVRVK